MAGDRIAELRVEPPRIVAVRVMEARKAIGLNKAQLAKEIGVSRQLISDLELGHKQPGHETLIRLSRVLGQPIYFFTHKDAGGALEGSTFFRSTSAKTKVFNEQCIVWKRWLHRVWAYLAARVRFPAVDVPDADRERPEGGYRPEEIEEIATQCRRAWGLGDGPIANMPVLLERHGIPVARVGFAADHTDAFTGLMGDRPFMFVESDKFSGARRNFDAAHELGHVVLHRHVTQEQIENPEEHKRIEHEANKFAGAFMMPAASFPFEISSGRIDQFLQLKPRWKMSIGAMVSRCSELGIYDETQTLNLRKEISRRRWRTREPLDEEIRFEHQGMLRRGLGMVIEAGETTPERLLREVGLSPDWIERLTGFPASSFASAPVEPVSLELRSKLSPI